ncbi:MAG: AzlD domain-containing protein [Actinomycetota bacterium]
MTVLIAILLAGVGTYLLRASLVLAPASVVVSPRLVRILPLVAPAVLAAIIASSLFVAGGRPTLPPLLDIAVVGIALVVVRRTGNLGMSLIVGLPLYWAGVLVGLT